MALHCIAGSRECDGCMWCEPDMPLCEVCGEEIDTYYIDANDEIVGCPECIRKIDAWDAKEGGRYEG